MIMKAETKIVIQDAYPSRYRAFQHPLACHSDEGGVPA